MAEANAINETVIGPDRLPVRQDDIFRGYFPEDYDSIAGILPPSVTPVPNAFTDALGVRVMPSYCPWIWDRVGTAETKIPIPTDTYLGEAVEYFAFAHAIATAPGRENFSVVELGAGWGPWVSLGGVVAPRFGFKTVNLVALEADPGRFDAMREHLAVNEIVARDQPDFGQRPGFTWHLHSAAAHWEDGTLYWPASTNAQDAAIAAIRDADTVIDYRGHAVETVAIKAVAVTTAIAHLDTVDLMHIDIQGGEEDLMPKIIDAMTAKVRMMMIGTHSRKIEGNFIGLFEAAGWMLVRERPCQFYSMAPVPTLTGRTYVDGAQLWINLRIPQKVA